MKTTLFAATLSCSSLLFGCSGTASEATSSSAADALSASSTLSGTYEEVGFNDVGLPYYSYVFKSDNTFKAVGGCRPSVDHCFAISEGSGTWTITGHGESAKVKLAYDSGNEATYYVSSNGNTLMVNKTRAGSTAYFFKEEWTKDIPIGGVCQDDAGNSLGNCEDSGNFGCGLDGTDDNVNTCVPLN
jgi:hypothetical protein